MTLAGFSGSLAQYPDLFTGVASSSATTPRTRVSHTLAVQLAAHTGIVSVFVTPILGTPFCRCVANFLLRLHNSRIQPPWR